MIRLSSYIDQARGMFGELIRLLSVRNLLRKLLLYPAELRGPSTPVIIELAAALLSFSSSLITFQHVSQFGTGKSPVILGHNFERISGEINGETVHRYR